MSCIRRKYRAGRQPFRSIQTSESFAAGALLSLAGGYLDAYSYLGRGGVFANAETGNIVLLAIRLISFEWTAALRYLLPIAAYGAGVLLSELVRSRRERFRRLHWRQLLVLLEILTLAVTAFLPQSMNPVVNSVISMVCGMQVTAFAKFHGYAMATTMCTGNLRSGTQSLYRYRLTGERELLWKGLLYFLCILCFILGAMLGGRGTMLLAERAVLPAAGILVLVLALMFSERLS
ncbi:YoaK family protein [Lachnoclostridium sp. Marseille-P6806]|uniref:YoaK family protein n=1 Tax=Lachnoclostridium sp. Marseille-P6806 TaxID=2364793 RepID=UPI001031725D|nr:YoaK family protein [Lachnoclostridium sp. Marseille-P6806]